MSQQTVLVTAAAGHIGSELIPQLLEGNAKLVLPTSNASRLRSNLPPSATEDNVAIEQGSFKDPLWLEQIISKHKVDTVFLCLTGTDEFMVSLNFFSAMQRAGTVKRLAFLSGCGDFVSDEGFNHVYGSHGAMHFLVKPAIERKLRFTPYPWTTVVLGPTLFWDNDLRSKETLLNEGLFDEPLGDAGVARVSTEDIARVARNAILEHDKWAGKKIMIGSKHRYTSRDIEDLWTKAIGRDVKMLAADEAGFQAFEDGFIAKQANGGQYSADAKAWGRDLRLMYEAFANVGFGMTDEDYEQQVLCLGRPPRDYKEFVAETGKSWTS